MKLKTPFYFKELPVWLYDPDPKHGEGILRRFSRLLFVSGDAKQSAAPASVETHNTAHAKEHGWMDAGKWSRDVTRIAGDPIRYETPRGSFIDNRNGTITHVHTGTVYMGAPVCSVYQDGEWAWGSVFAQPEHLVDMFGETERPPKLWRYGEVMSLWSSADAFVAREKRPRMIFQGRQDWRLASPFELDQLNMCLRCPPYPQSQLDVEDEGWGEGWKYWDDAGPQEVREKLFGDMMKAPLDFWVWSSGWQDERTRYRWPNVDTDRKAGGALLVHSAYRTIIDEQEFDQEQMDFPVPDLSILRLVTLAADREEFDERSIVYKVPENARVFAGETIATIGSARIAAPLAGWITRLKRADITSGGPLFSMIPIRGMSRHRLVYRSYESLLKMAWFAARHRNHMRFRKRLARLGDDVIDAAVRSANELSESRPQLSDPSEAHDSERASALHPKLIAQLDNERSCHAGLSSVESNEAQGPVVRYETPRGAFLDNRDGTVTHVHGGTMYMGGPVGTEYIDGAFRGEMIRKPWEFWADHFGRSPEPSKLWKYVTRVEHSRSGRGYGYCQGRSRMEFAGYRDWRLPTIFELDHLAMSDQCPPKAHHGIKRVLADGDWLEPHHKDARETRQALFPFLSVTKPESEYTLWSSVHGVHRERINSTISWPTTIDWGGSAGALLVRSLPHDILNTEDFDDQPIAVPAPKPELLLFLNPLLFDDDETPSLEYLTEPGELVFAGDVIARYGTARFVAPLAGRIVHLAHDGEQGRGLFAMLPVQGMPRDRLAYRSCCEVIKLAEFVLESTGYFRKQMGVLSDEIRSARKAEVRELTAALAHPFRIHRADENMSV